MAFIHTAPLDEATGQAKEMYDEWFTDLPLELRQTRAVGRPYGEVPQSI